LIVILGSDFNFQFLISQEAKMPASQSYRSASVVQTLAAKLVRLSQPTAIAPANDRGLTLLECLVAIMVIAVTVTAITPPVFVAVATRLQNQRTEQAQQLAQQEIDRVRLLMESNRYASIDLPPVAGGSFAAVGAPITAPNKNRPPSNAPLQAFLVDLNNDGQDDFLVQTYRENGVFSPKDATRPVAFRMGVRVYAATARRNLGSLRTDIAAIKFVTGEGQSVNRPLAVLNTIVARSDSNDSLALQCQLINGGGAGICPSP
jgi:prepilin-type N-terminal cleavage/methylation domain-containing protein